jgi:hypothetical protein
MAAARLAATECIPKSMAIKVEPQDPRNILPNRAGIEQSQLRADVAEVKPLLGIVFSSMPVAFPLEKLQGFGYSWWLCLKC